MDLPGMMRIWNTLQLGEVAVSEAYAKEVKKRDDLEVIEDVRPIRFDAQGNIKRSKFENQYHPRYSWLLLFFFLNQTCIAW